MSSGLQLWLMVMGFLGVFEILMILIWAYSRRYKGKAVGKVTDVFRHDYNDHGREAPTGFGDHVYFEAHYVFEVNGVKYRGYGNITRLSTWTRKVNVRYDVDDPSRFCLETSSAIVIIPLIIMALCTAVYICLKQLWG